MSDSIMGKLGAIQQTLSVPKNQCSDFGNYKYRSCEDILENLKPCLKATNTALTISDDVVEISGRFYVKATATLTDCETEQSVSNTAYAREAESKKGMDVSQVTGATSSYARKYALNGLFCIDDTKDADSMDNSKSGKKQDKTEDKQITPDMIRAIEELAKKKGIPESQICKRYGVAAYSDLRISQYRNAMSGLEKSKDAGGEN